MDKLIEAIITEVRVHHGIRPDMPTPEALKVNLEGRIKGYVAATLGLCEPLDVLNKLEMRLELARIQDQRNGLTGRWYDEHNAKHLA